MIRPGDRLRKIASHVFSETTMERVVDPALADLQTEYAQAVGRGSVWASRWIRLVGYAALLKVVAFCAWRRSVDTMGDRASEQPIVGLAVGWSFAATAVAMFLLALPIALRIASRLPARQLTVLVYLAPSQFSIALPIGVMLGVLYGLRGVVVSRRSNTMILVVAVACSVASFVNVAWVVPVANQAYRAAVGLPRGSGTVNEWTLNELSHQIDTEARDGNRDAARLLSIGFHRRWGMSCAPLALAFLALSVVSRRRGGRFAFAVVAAVSYFGYYLILSAGQAFAMADMLSVSAAAWLPNAASVLAALGVMKLVPSSSPAAARS